MDIPHRYKHNTTSFAHYWSKGVGKDLLKKLGYTPDLEKAKEFIPLLFQWDSLGDQVVLDVHEKVGFLEGNKTLLNHLDNKPLNSDYKPHIEDFFNSFESDPAWLDKKKLSLGSELSRRAGISALIVLRDYCLMGGYESAAINKPLIYTGALKKGAVKRLTDTVEFWVLIAKENGLEKDSEGFKQIMLTRMIHSYSRINILKKTDWETNKWGIPINYWDMLATNLGFSLVFLVGLRRMGINPSDEEVDGLFHFWKYIGYLLGIPLEILPNNELEAIQALYYWTMTQREGDQDTLELVNALKEEPVKSFYPKSHLMRKMMREVHLFYNHYLLGDYSCNLLGLPQTHIGRFGIINIWRTKKLEAKILTADDRLKAIIDGGNEQERVRQIYQEFNK